MLKTVKSYFKPLTREQFELRTLHLLLQLDLLQMHLLLQKLLIWLAIQLSLMVMMLHLSKAINDHNIPDELICGGDETNTQFVPSGRLEQKKVYEDTGTVLRAHHNSLANREVLSCLYIQSDYSIPLKNN